MKNQNQKFPSLLQSAEDERRKMNNQKNMTAYPVTGQVTRPIEVGNIVENFGAIARVDLITERGLLLTIIPWIKNGIAQGGVGQRYYADPARCERVAA